jgi:hypothetical protein
LFLKGAFPRLLAHPFRDLPMRTAVRLLCRVAGGLAVILPLAAAPGAQPTWISLGGPGDGGGGLLAADAAGTFYSVSGGDVVRSADGGLTWTATGYPGTAPRSLDVAPDGRVLVAADRVWRYDGSAWADLGLDGAEPRRVTASGAGRLATVVGIPRDCTVAISDNDGQTWTTHAPVGHSTIPGCVDAHVAEDGHVFVVWQSTPTMPSARVYTSADGGATWTNLSFDYAARLVRGQHGGLFLISVEIRAMFSPFSPSYPPRLRRYADGAWTVLLNRDVAGVTTRADGSVLVGYPHSLSTLDGTMVAQISAPRHIAVSASGATLVSSADHGRFRYDGARWRQEGAPLGPVNFLDASGGGLVASTGWPGAVLRHDGDAWVAEWGQHRPSARAVLDGEAWYAVAGWHTPSRPGAEPRGYTPTYRSLGLWRGDALQPTPLPYQSDGETFSCDYACIVASVAASDGVLLAGVVGQDEEDIVNSYPAGLYRSADAGATWTRTLPDVHGCHLAAHGDLVLTASTPCSWSGWGPEPPLASRSIDGGLTWTPIEAGLPTGTTGALHIGPNGTAYLAHHADVFRLDGDAWTRMHVGARARALATSGDGRLLALTDQGLRAWDGVNWTWIETPPGRALHTLAAGDDGILYLGTDAGVYATEGPLAVSTEPPATASPTSLGVPFPNPARAGAVVPFTLAEAGPVSLVLYDLLGRRVAVLAEGALGAGAHEALVPDRLAPGVYVVELRAGGARHAQRLVLTTP